MVDIDKLHNARCTDLQAHGYESMMPNRGATEAYAVGCMLQEIAFRQRGQCVAFTPCEYNGESIVACGVCNLDWQEEYMSPVAARQIELDLDMLWSEEDEMLESL